MTLNQLRLLIDVYTGQIEHQDRESYPATLDKDYSYLQSKGYVIDHRVSQKGTCYLDAAASIKLEQKYEAYL